MRIKIKYCGGCNAAYDRVKFVKDLSQALRQKVSEDVVFITNEESADIGIIICGCSACCADQEEIKNGVIKWHIVGPDLLDYAYTPQAEIIDNLIEKLIWKGGP